MNHVEILSGHEARNTKKKYVDQYNGWEYLKGVDHWIQDILLEARIRLGFFPIME